LRMAEVPVRSAKGAATRRNLVETARRLFVAKGYAATGTDEIVSESGVGSKGALYHHFADKRALFDAVLQQVLEDFAARAATKTPEFEDPLDLLREGLHAFLDAAVDDPAVLQVVLIDGPAVLGWDVWRLRQEAYGQREIALVLDLAVSDGVIAPGSTKVRSHLLLALVNESALYIANSKSRRSARREVGTTFDELVDGLRIANPPKGRSSTRR